MADERKLEAVKELAAYRVAKEKFVEEMDSGAMVLEHIKSGALVSGHLLRTAPAFRIFWNTACWRGLISSRSRTRLWNWSRVL